MGNEEREGRRGKAKGREDKGGEREEGEGGNRGRKGMSIFFNLSTFTYRIRSNWQLP